MCTSFNLINQDPERKIHIYLRIWCYSKELTYIDIFGTAYHPYVEHKHLGIGGGQRLNDVDFLFVLGKSWKIISGILTKIQLSRNSASATENTHFCLQTEHIEPMQ